MTVFVQRARGTLAAALLFAGCAGVTPASAPTSAAPTSTVAPATVAPTTKTLASPTTAATTAGPTRLATARFEIDQGSYIYDLAQPAVTFTVPEHWLMTETFPRHFGLRPDNFVAEDSIRTWYDMRIAAKDGACSEAPEPGLDHTAADLLADFIARPGLEATTPRPITLGGLGGHWVDLDLADGWTTPCPFTDGVAAVTLFVDDAVPDENAFWGVSGPGRMRLFVLDDGVASNVLITIDSAGGASFDDLVAAAMPVIETFDFVR